MQDVSPAAPVVGSRLPLDFRLRTAVADTRPSLLDDPEGRVRRRIASSMFDFYPSGDGAGFHLSAGVRYYDRTNFAIEAQKMTHGLLFAPSWKNGSATRAGLKRFTPAMTAGYSGLIAKNMLLGIEGGALLGRVNTASPLSLRRPVIGNGFDERSGVNPVVNFVLGFRF